MRGFALFVSAFYITYRGLVTFIFMPLAGSTLMGADLLEVAAPICALAAAIFVYTSRRAPALISALATLIASVTYASLGITADHGAEVGTDLRAFVLPELVFFVTVGYWFWMGGLRDSEVRQGQ